MLNRRMDKEGVQRINNNNKNPKSKESNYFLVKNVKMNKVFSYLFPKTFLKFIL